MQGPENEESLAMTASGEGEVPISSAGEEEAGTVPTEGPTLSISMSTQSLVEEAALVRSMKCSECGSYSQQIQRKVGLPVLARVSDKCWLRGGACHGLVGVWHDPCRPARSRQSEMGLCSRLCATHFVPTSSSQKPGDEWWPVCEGRGDGVAGSGAQQGGEQSQTFSVTSACSAETLPSS
jgi:hypothetical protein